MKRYASEERLPAPGQRLDEIARAPVDPTLDRISFILDKAIRVPGTNIRFGLDPIISFLLPAAGDVVSSLVSAYIVLSSVRYGLPKIVIARMVFNVGLDYLTGTIPLIGDLFDFAWKANDKNMKLLNRHAAGAGQSKWSDWAWVLVLLGGLGFMLFGILALIYLAFRSFGSGLL
jgi:hypothetical protein